MSILLFLDLAEEKLFDRPVITVTESALKLVECLLGTVNKPCIEQIGGYCEICFTVRYTFVDSSYGMSDIEFAVPEKSDERTDS